MTRVSYDYHLNESIGGFIESGHLFNLNRKCRLRIFFEKKRVRETGFDSDRRPSEQISHWHTEKQAQKKELIRSGRLSPFSVGNNPARHPVLMFGHWTEAFARRISIY
uniref:hypothetical protein n=1 Tax=Jatropha curcas TaxID=180498 RepID=UPI0027A15C7B|nr:hypothetical protein QLP06_mgp112 [Jatropha curcas]WFG81127.1 hypothetical protein [Jatropha curcas]